MTTTLAAKLTANELSAVAATDAIPVLGDPGGTPDPGMALLSTVLGAWPVLEDLATLGANAADGEFLVGTGAGALAWESGSTVLGSLGVPSLIAQYSITISSGQYLHSFSGDFAIAGKSNTIEINNNNSLGWAASPGSGHTSGLQGGDTYLNRDAAGVVNFRKTGQAHEVRVSAAHASSTDFHRSTRKSATATLSAVSGATVTASGLIPAGVKLIGISTKVTTGLGTTNGTTGYAVGDSGDPNLWGDIVGTAAGTSSDNGNATADPAGTWSASARDVILTAAGGNFDGTGVIEVYAHYDDVEAD